MKRSRFNQWRRRIRRDEEGQALVLALVFLVVFALMLTALLSGVNVNFNMTAVTKDQSQLQYAADAGIEWGINRLAQSGSECNSGTQIPQTPFYPVLNSAGSNPDGSLPFTLTPGVGSGAITPKVYCEPLTGVGSGTFAGYTVVTGMNYPGTPGYPSYTSPYGSQEYAGQQICTSLSGDPVGSGSSTYASQVTLSSGTQTSGSPPACLSYPPNPWTDSDFAPDFNGSPVIPGNVNQAFASDATDVYAVGAGATATTSGAGTIGPGPSWTLTSPTLFTSSSLVGSVITDTANALAKNSTIKSVNTATHTATVMPNPTATSSSDTFSIAGAKSGGIYHFDAQDDFTYVGTGTPSTTLNGVWSPPGDPNHVWAVGNSGLILECGANCTNESAAWLPQATGTTTQNLNSVTGLSTSALWAAGANGTLLSYNGILWTPDSLSGQSPVTGPGTITGMGATTTISSPLFTGSANYKGWTITDTGGGFGANTKIQNETNGTLTGTVTVMPAPKQDVAGDLFTLTPPAGSTPTFTSIYADGNGNIWAAGSANNSGVIYECANPCSTISPTWTQVPVSSPPTTYSAITANTAGGNTALWAVGASSISVCPSSCGTASNWTTSTKNGDTFTAIAAGDASDVWLVGSNGANPLILYCTSSCTTTGATWTAQAINDQESTLNTVTAVPAGLRTDQSTWAASVWTAGIIPTGNPPANQSLGTGWAGYTPYSTTANVLLQLKGGNVVNGGALNAATPMKVESGNFVQFDTAGCPSQPSSLQISNGTYSCATSMSNPLVSPLTSLDEPLPSECSSSATCSAGGISASKGIASCVAASSCTDLSGTSATISTGSSSCPSFTEYFPGYYKNFPHVNTNGTTYFASGLYYFAGGGAGAFDSNISNPGYIIGGQPGPGDVPTVVTSSPCWPYISANWQTLDSKASSISGSWYEGGGATTSPNGTGVSWVLGNGTWFDVHTIDLELFTRQVPDYTSFGPSASQTVSQEKNEGTFGLTLREVPPQCPSGVSQSNGYTDGAVHPGPYCVTTTSKWIPLTPGVKNQALQIDANNHNPFVYIHGAIYMPDNNVTLFTDQSSRDVWVGALDVNSLELTFDTATSPAIQITGGGSPQVAKAELISEAQDPNSPTTVWEEAVVNEPPFGSSQLPTIQSWRYCNGNVTSPSSQTAFIQACGS